MAAVHAQARTQVLIITVQDIHPLQGCRLLQLAAEAWELTRQVEENWQALSESAAELVHLFEEQSWLRDIARNTANLARAHSAVELANHILEPLVYLLKTQDLFLIVDPEETACIGLTDRKYGASPLSTAAVRRLLTGLGFTRDSAAIVKNNARFVTADGLVKSIVAVPSLARIYGLSENACQEVYLSGILHDIGKIGVPDAVLLKNGPLTAEEFKVIQTHPEIGHRIVEKLGHLQFVLPGILYHHERWDGYGYPPRIKWRIDSADGPHSSCRRCL